MKLRNPWRRLSTSVMCSILAGCGGESSPTAPTSQLAAAAAPATTVVAQGTQAGLARGFLYSTPPFMTAAAGRLDVTVDWTFARNDVDVFLLRGIPASCTISQFNANQCDLVATAESRSAKPERISVASLAAGTYTIYVGNWGPDEESVSFQAVLTRGAIGSNLDTSRQPR